MISYHIISYHSTSYRIMLFFLLIQAMFNCATHHCIFFPSPAFLTLEIMIIIKQIVFIIMMIIIIIKKTMTVAWLISLDTTKIYILLWEIFCILYRKANIRTAFNSNLLHPWDSTIHYMTGLQGTLWRRKYSDVLEDNRRQ